ncbi:hypothetical protein DM01DRAFT_55340 [Hesseltinella vesiculosa]|uniref:DNA 5'-3' helicase n=1 Tax=Hesseltinella vesiculosa TaxID=101127 RepID=A0A1X2GKN2_9FUNG|nr:hypothetical protein DM01DRAFT_55340 [Hesseltinella vesiculosa]
MSSITMPICGVQVEFPFKPYPAQIQLMAKIIQALKKKENALLESPTGSGKSLAILCASLAWQRHRVKELREQREQEYIEANAKAKAQAEQLLREEIALIANNENKTMDNGDPACTGAKDDTAPIQIGPHSLLRGILPDLRSDAEDSDDFQPIQVSKRRKIFNQAPAEAFDPVSSCGTASDAAAPLSSQALQTPSDVSLLETQSDVPLKMHKQVADPTQSPKEPPVKMPRIFVCSRTHKQIQQLIGELRNNTSYRPRMAVLGSREQLCIHPKLANSNTKDDDCKKLRDKNACSFSHRKGKVLAHPKIAPNYGNIWDIEDINKVGRSVQGCPYFASQTLYNQAEVIFCPYNYVISPLLRERLEIGEDVIIIDEAHNIEDISRSSGSFEVSESELKRIKKHLREITEAGILPEQHNHIHFVVDSVLEWILDTNETYTIKEYDRHIRLWSGQDIFEKLTSMRINAMTLKEFLLPAFAAVKKHTNEVSRLDPSDDVEEFFMMTEGAPADARSEPSNSRSARCLPSADLKVLDGLFMVLGYLFQEGKNRQDDYSMVLIKKIHTNTTYARDASWAYKLAFWCHNPGIVFSELSSMTHSMVLTSGTLSPLDTFATELETKFDHCIETNHVIDKSQVWIKTMPIAPNGSVLKGVFATMETLQYQDGIGQALQQIVDAVPFGVLCFLPSYSAMDKLLNRWKTTGIYDSLASKKRIFTEPRGDNKSKFVKLISDFYSSIRESEQIQADDRDKTTNGALFFAVYRGKVSEGIDFSNNDCRAVVAIGVPYPNL